VPDTEQVTIRGATPDDLGDVVAAYNAGIKERVATFETTLRSPGDVADWLRDGQPFVVAEQAGRVRGWARAASYSDRCVYRGVGDHAVYVHPDGRGQGLGGLLLTELCAESERRGLYKLTSRVFTENLPSRRAHRAAGFEEVGIQRRHGKLDGTWTDCVLVERLLGEAASPTEA
jgi:L-amino acid N-acyltransferase YncA